MGILLGILLALIKQPKFYNRLHEVPLAASDPTEFHHLYAKKFLQRCNSPWPEMSYTARVQYLCSFFVQKFSYDPKLQCMNPGVGAKRKPWNDACWSGFELLDEEVSSLASTTIHVFYQELGQ